MTKRLAISTRPALTAPLAVLKSLGGDIDKEDRILFVDKKEDIKTGDRPLEKRILDDIGRSL